MQILRYLKSRLEPGILGKKSIIKTRNRKKEEKVKKNNNRRQ